MFTSVLFERVQWPILLAKSRITLPLRNFLSLHL